MIDVNERTMEFLLACKGAGYERVTVCVTDKRVPDSVRIKKGSTGDYWGRGTPASPFKVVCGAPPMRCKHHFYRRSKKPAMWTIVKELGLHYAGAGNGDGHDILTPSQLTAGYYDLAEIE